MFIINQDQWGCWQSKHCKSSMGTGCNLMPSAGAEMCDIYFFIFSSCGNCRNRDTSTLGVMYSTFVLQSCMVFIVLHGVFLSQPAMHCLLLLSVMHVPSRGSQVEATPAHISPPAPPRPGASGRELPDFFLELTGFFPHQLQSDIWRVKA